MATVGIFLPAFVFVALERAAGAAPAPLAVAGAVLDGVNVASLALMAVVAWQLATGALVDADGGAGGRERGCSFCGLRVNSSWLVLAGAIAGYAGYARE